MCANSPKSHPPLSSGPTLPSVVSPLVMKPPPTSCPPHVRCWEDQTLVLWHLSKGNSQLVGAVLTRAEKQCWDAGL